MTTVTLSLSKGGCPTEELGHDDKGESICEYYYETVYNLTNRFRKRVASRPFSLNGTEELFTASGQFIHHLSLILGKIFEGEGFLPVQVEFQEHEIQLSDLLESFLVIIKSVHQ